MKRKKKIILLTIIVVVGLSSIFEFKKNAKNNIQAGKLKGYGTSEKAIKEYLEAFVNKDAESVMSSYCLEGMEKAAANRGLSMEKLYKKETEQLDEIFNNRNKEITEYKYSLEKELNNDEIEELFAGYEPERVHTYEISFVSEESSQNLKFRIYTVCYDKKWYIMNLENINPDDFYIEQ